MSPWSIRRKRIIFSLVLIFLILVVGLPLFFFVYKSPTCSDGKQNGDETGLDCGGGCELLCQADNLPIILNGDPQVIQVASTTYAMVVEAENPNINAEIKRAQYTFKVYEMGGNVPIKIVDGQTFVPKGSKFAVFVGPFDFGESIPGRVTFDWKAESLIWDKNISEKPTLLIENTELINTTSEPRLSADVTNQSLEDVKYVELMALVYDLDGNTIGASKTFIEVLRKGETEPIVFTWPAPFKNEHTSIEILIKILPDKSFL